MPPRDSKRPSSWPDRRPLLLGGLVAVCLAIAIGYTALAVVRTSTEQPSGGDTSAAAPDLLASVVRRPHLIFLHSPGGDTYPQQVAVLPLDALDGPTVLTPLRCRRVYMAGGSGLCMDASRIGVMFDERFQVVSSFQLRQPARPTRTRVSPSGELGSMTWFVAGHSYSDAQFSTDTLLVDPRTGQTVADLEQFTVLRDGWPFRAVDFNFWGVTFARDGSSFYATLASGGRTYLVEGDVARREARVLRENVECPSLSPDGTRLAFKKRTDPESAREWRLAILDLATLADSPVPGESHSVDDQVEWLDDTHILYALPDEGAPGGSAQDIWMASLDGSAPPKKLLKGAMSPAVVR